MDGQRTEITLSAAEMDEEPTYEECRSADKLSALTSSVTKSGLSSSNSLGAS